MGGEGGARRRAVRRINGAGKPEQANPSDEERCRDVDQGGPRDDGGEAEQLHEP